MPLYTETVPPYEPEKWVSGKLRPDGKPGFPTSSGKLEIHSTILENFGYHALPVYEDGGRGSDCQPTEKDFPLTLTTGARIRSAFRSQHLNIPGLLRLQPECRAIIHARDAGPGNISNGDKVTVITPYGRVGVTAHVTINAIPGVVEVNQGGGSPIQAEGWKASNVNLITDEKNRDPISGFPVFKALSCRIEKM